MGFLNGFKLFRQTDLPGMSSLLCQWRGSIALKPDVKTCEKSTSLNGENGMFFLIQIRF